MKDRKGGGRFAKQTPSVVKPQEAGRINAFYTNISLSEGDDEHIKLVPGVPYMWVYNENEEIIIGVEEPWKYPQAFSAVGKPLNKVIFDAVKKSGRLGHPTLTSKFEETGAADAHRGRAYIGGELHYANDEWILNNHSGRFGKLKNKPEDVIGIMNVVGDKLSKALGIQVVLDVTLPQAKYLKAYNKIWQKGQADLDRAILLLQDYVKTGSVTLTFTGHWGRNHVALVQDCLKQWAQSPPHDVNDILIHLSLALEGVKIVADSSLLRRLHYIAAHTNNSFKIGDMTGLVDVPGTCDQLLIPDEPRASEDNIEKGKEEERLTPVRKK